MREVDAKALFDPPELEAQPSAEVFVRALALPTASLKAARAAVAMQLDILSPLPADRTVTSVEKLGPAEGDRTRYAVAFAPASLFAEGVGGPPWIELDGQLDGEILTFRFDNPARAKEAGERRRESWRLAAVSGLCLAMLMGALDYRLDRDIAAREQRIEDLQTRLKALGGPRTARGQPIANAGMTACAFEILASPGGAVTLSDLTVEQGVVQAGFAQPLTPEQVQMLASHKVTAASEQEAAGEQRRVLIDQEACR